MQRELISILYNLIHCFINADESMTDITVAYSYIFKTKQFCDDVLFTRFM